MIKIQQEMTERDTPRYTWMASDQQAALVLEMHRMLMHLYNRFLTAEDQARLREELWEDDWDEELVGDEALSEHSMLVDLLHMVENLHEERFGSAPEIESWPKEEEILKDLVARLDTLEDMVSDISSDLAELNERSQRRWWQ